MSTVRVKSQYKQFLKFTKTTHKTSRQIVPEQLEVFPSFFFMLTMKYIKPNNLLDCPIMSTICSARFDT